MKANELAKRLLEGKSCDTCHFYVGTSISLDGSIDDPACWYPKGDKLREGTCDNWYPKSK